MSQTDKTDPTRDYQKFLNAGFLKKHLLFLAMILIVTLGMWATYYVADSLQDPIGLDRLSKIVGTRGSEYLYKALAPKAQELKKAFSIWYNFVAPGVCLLWVLLNIREFKRLTSKSRSP